MFRRNYGMNYQQRQEYRAQRSAQIARGKNAKVATLDRLKETVIIIEDAFKPEADRLYKYVVSTWVSAHAFVMESGQTYNSVRTALTGRDFEANPIPEFRGTTYVSRNGKYTDAYARHLREIQAPLAVLKMFDATQQAFIITHRLFDLHKLTVHAEKDAAEIVEANKAKLLNAVATYLAEFETVTVTNKDFVKASIKGFQGDFYITTDKGPRLFTCKAITAEGPVISFHWRFIAHVKEVTAKKKK